MPRFRFQWSNIDSIVILSLIDSLKLTGAQDSSEVLRKKYGAKPGDDFIKDAWPILLDNWLAKDSQFATIVANGARTNALGNTAIKDDLEYLRTCRNTIGLRREALKVFLAYGEQSKTDPELNRLLPSSTGNNSTEDVGQQNENDASSAGQENGSLVDLVKDAISNLYSVDVEKILVDDDGDIGVPCGSALVFVRFPTNVNAIRLFSILLRNIPEGNDVHGTLNDINSNINAGFLYYSDSMIFLEHTILADGGLSVANLACNINYFTDTADFFDDKLKERFGGDLCRASGLSVLPENLINAFKEAESNGMGLQGEALANLKEFITDIESFTKVFLSIEDERTKASIAEAYPVLYMEYAKANGLIDPLYDMCCIDFSGPCVVVTVDGVDRLLLEFGVGVYGCAALADSRFPISETVEPDNFQFVVDEWDAELNEVEADFPSEFQPVTLPETILNGASNYNTSRIWVDINNPFADPDEWIPELLKFHTVNIGTKKFVECFGWGHSGSQTKISHLDCCFNEFS